MKGDSWDCPECGKHHSKVHYAFPDQVDTKKKPQQEGRVKFDRENDCGDGSKYSAKGDTPTKYGLAKTGPDKEDDGTPSPLFCPHCGWLQELVIIVKTTKKTSKKRSPL